MSVLRPSAFLCRIRFRWRSLALTRSFERPEEAFEAPMEPEEEALERARAEEEAAAEMRRQQEKQQQEEEKRQRE
ncbi:unnamed protein product, partial [Symbiodinium microadriaticum]